MFDRVRVLAAVAVPGVFTARRLHNLLFPPILAVHRLPHPVLKFVVSFVSIVREEVVCPSAS